MEETRFEAITRLIAQLTTRRAAVQSLSVAGIGSALGTILLDQDDIEAKKRHKKRKKHKRKKKCKPPKGRCGKKCVSLNTNENCGRCGNRCDGAETCQDGVCCAQPLCRGECRAECPPPTQNRKFPQELGYGLIHPSGGQSQLNADVEAAYDRWKARYLVGEDRDEEGHQVFRIAFGKPGTPLYGETTSEGQGYGMIIVAIMAGYDDEAREIFDGLWRFRLAHPSEIDPRLMDWHVPNNDGNDSAFDGDADIAYGLLLAEAQWGNDGPIDYGAAFAETVAGILESTIGPQSRLPMLGDWTDPNGSPYNQDTPRTSDFMIGHFRAFRRATGDGVWDNVISACQDVITALQANFSPDTGLLPEFAVEGPEPAPPGFLGSAHADDYDYNAGRVPWRLGTDALLNGDATSTAQAAAITKWAAEKTGGIPAALDSGYTLAGVSYADYFSTFFAAPMGVAAMTDPTLQVWLNALYGAVYNVSENYYEDTVMLLCLLVMTGNFWDPTLV